MAESYFTSFGANPPGGQPGLQDGQPMYVDQPNNIREAINARMAQLGLTTVTLPPALVNGDPFYSTMRPWLVATRLAIEQLIAATGYGGTYYGTFDNGGGTGGSNWHRWTKAELITKIRTWWSPMAAPAGDWMPLNIGDVPPYRDYLNELYVALELLRYWGTDTLAIVEGTYEDRLGVTPGPGYDHDAAWTAAVNAYNAASWMVNAGSVLSTSLLSKEVLSGSDFFARCYAIRTAGIGFVMPGPYTVSEFLLSHRYDLNLYYPDFSWGLPPQLWYPLEGGAASLTEIGITYNSPPSIRGYFVYTGPFGGGIQTLSANMNSIVGTTWNEGNSGLFHEWNPTHTLPSPFSSPQYVLSSDFGGYSNALWIPFQGFTPDWTMHFV